jgi:hypothetical protein
VLIAPPSDNKKAGERPLSTTPAGGRPRKLYGSG